MIATLTAPGSAHCRAVLDTMSEAWCEVDLAGRIRIWNNAAAGLLAPNGETLLGRQLLRMLTPEDARRARRALHALHGGGGPVQRLRLELGDRVAKARVVEVTASLTYDDAWIPCGFVLNAVDVTRCREAQQQLRRAHALATMGQVTMGVVHDFSNLLTSVMAGLDLIEEQLPPNDADIAAALSLMRRVTSRGATMTRGVLALSRPGPAVRSVTDVAGALDEVMPLIRRLVPEHIELALETPGEPLRVEIDSGAMEQVLLNLVTNARDAMPDGGTLHIRAERIAVGHGGVVDTRLTPGSYVRIEVADSGAGMVPEVLARAFDPFFTTKPPTRGTGLGLAMVRTLVEEHNGTVDAFSETERGTTIVLVLPEVAFPSPGLAGA